MKDRYLLFVISLLFCCLLQAQEKIDSLLVVLDRTIENTAQYEQARLKRIDQIKEYFRTRKSILLLMSTISINNFLMNMKRIFAIQQDIISIAISRLPFSTTIKSG